MSYPEVACRVLIGLVFAVSAASKLRRRAAFAAFVASVRALVPRADPVAPVLAAVIVGAELAIPVVLVPARTAPWALAAAAALLLAFTGALAAAMRRGVTTPCRCFGASSAPPGRSQLIRNALLTLAAVGGVLAPGAAVTPAGAAVAIGVGVVAALLAISADDIAVLFQPSRPWSQS